MGTISSLLDNMLRMAGGTPSKASGKASGKGSSSLENLPQSLQDLVASVNALTGKVDQSSEKELTDAQRRQKTSGMLQHRFMADLEELADVMSALNDTQKDASKEGARREKLFEQLQKRETGRKGRAKEELDVYERQRGQKQGNWLNFIGAAGGRGLQDLVEGFVRAGEQTKDDIAKISDSRYQEKIATAEEREADALASVEDRRQGEIRSIAGTYEKGISRRAAREGAEAVKVAEASAVLDELEKKEAAYAKAKAERDKIDAEGRARIQELEKSATQVTAPAPLPATSGMVPAVQGYTPTAAPGTILDASGNVAPPAARMAEIEKAKKDQAAAISEANARVSAAEPSQELRAKAEVARAAIAGGELSANGPDRLAEWAQSAVAGVNKRANEDANQIRAAAVREKAKAEEMRDAGSLVSDTAKKAIGTTNMLTGAVMPPAIQAITKSVEEFTKLFPVVGQAGSAIVEVSSAIPAGFMLLSTAIPGALLQAVASLKESFKWTKSDVGKRYEESDAAWVDKEKKTRSQAFEEAEVAQVEKFKERNNLDFAGSGKSLVSANTFATARANAPKEFTVATLPSASGATGMAPSAKESYEEKAARDRSAAASKAMEGYRPNYAPSVGVVPVGASNRNIDEWR